MDPVTLGLCSQIDLDLEVQRAAKEKPLPAASGTTLLPAEVTTRVEEVEPEEEARPGKANVDLSKVFAKFQDTRGQDNEGE